MTNPPTENRTAIIVVIAVTLLLLAGLGSLFSPSENGRPRAPIAKSSPVVEKTAAVAKKTTPSPRPKVEPNPTGLRTRVSIELVGLKLGPVIEHLATLGGFQVVFDARDVKGGRIDVDEEVGAAVFRQATIRQVVDHLLKRSDLAWIYEDEVVKISIAESVAEKMTSEIYPVASLLKPPVPAVVPAIDLGPFSLAGDSMPNGVIPVNSFDGFGAASFDPLSEELTMALRAGVDGVWEILDSDGGTTSELPGLLAIRQTRRVHGQIAELLRGLEIAANNQLGAGGHVVEHSQETRLANAAARVALDRVISVDYNDVQLGTMLKEIGQKTGLSIIGHVTGLNSFEVELKTEVSLSVKKVKARSALSLALQQLDLSYYVEDGLIIVAQPETVEKHQFAMIYNIRTLLRAGVDTLLIEEAVQGQTDGIWEENDPENGGKTATVENLGVLVVTQTAAVHRQIKKLLAKLSERIKTVKTKTASPTEESDPESIVIRYYPQTFEDKAKALEAAIRTFVAPKTWTANDSECTIMVVEGTLVIRQKIKVHRKIREFLDNLTIAETQGGLGNGGLSGSATGSGFFSPMGTPANGSFGF